MRAWAWGIGLAVVFAALGAFAASLWLEVRRETPAGRATVATGHWAGRRIRVEVLNGAGVDGLAWRATERLRERGFDVVYFGNAESFGRDTSVAIARLDSLEPARRVADALGIRHVVDRRDENLYLDVTVILGRDWAEPEPSEAGDEEGTAGSWWQRVRRAAARLWPG